MAVVSSPIPALIAAARRRVARHFRDAGATDATRAIAFDDDHRLERQQFRRLVKRGVIVEVGSGRYYLDTPAYEEFQRKLRGKVAIAIGVAVAGALWAIMA